MTRRVLAGVVAAVAVAAVLGAGGRPPTGEDASAHKGAAPGIADTAQAAPALVDGDSWIGVNLSSLVDWSDEDPFLDRFRLSREWIPQCVAGTDPGCTRSNAWDTGEQDQIAVDADGWVARLPARSDPPVFTRVSTLLMVAGARHNDYAGRYVVRYAGSGALEYSLGASLVEGSPGRDLIQVESDGFALLTITATDPVDPVRDISVIRVEDETLAATQTFSPTWLARLAPFRTLRFMDWMRTNNSTQRQVADLAAVDDARWTTDAGAPAAVMTAAANAVQAEPWFTVPHRATDAYVSALASAVHRGLSPGLRVYVEYSNEVWNDGFSQGAWIEQQAQAEFPGGTDSGFTKRMNWHGRRTAEVCALWRAAFGADSGRVTCVLGAQAANTFTAAAALDCALWRDDPDNPDRGRTCQELGIDAVAIAPYVGGYLGDPALAGQVRGLSLDQLFAELLRGGVVHGSGVPPGGALAEAAGWMTAYDELAADRGLRVLAYEGGQHLVGVAAAQEDTALETLFVAANRDARMGEVYRRHLLDWRTTERGTRSLYVAFSFAARYGPYGSWGLLEHVEQPSSPKYDAVAQAAAAVACWWPGCTVTQDPAAVPGGSTTNPTAPPGSGALARQRPVPRLTLPHRLRPRGLTRLMRLPVTTTAGQRARVTLSCHPRGRPGALGCGRDLDVRRTSRALAVRLRGIRPLVVTVRITAAAVSGFSALDRVRVYRTVTATR